MTLINTGLLTKGLRSEFFNRFENTPTLFGDLATRVVSNADREVYRWLGTVPKMRLFDNGRLTQGLRTESYSVDNLKYEATIEVDRDEISDDQTGQIRMRVAELAQRAATHKDYLISQLLVDGESAGLSYDGVSFFNNAHVSGDSGNQGNVLSYNVATPAAPTSDEFKAALMQAIGTMLAFKDDQAEPMMIDASGMVIVVPPNMLFAAFEAINSPVMGNHNNVIHNVARVVSLPWLTNTDKWYLLKTNGTIRPFIFQDREPLEFNALTEDSEEGFRREKFLYGVRARYRLTYGYWQYAVRTTLT